MLKDSASPSLRVLSLSKSGWNFETRPERVWDGIADTFVIETTNGIEDVCGSLAGAFFGIFSIQPRVRVGIYTYGNGINEAKKIANLTGVYIVRQCVGKCLSPWIIHSSNSLL